MGIKNFMNNQKAIQYLKNTIEFNDLDFGSVRQISEVIRFLEQQETPLPPHPLKIRMIKEGSGKSPKIRGVN